MGWPHQRVSLIPNSFSFLLLCRVYSEGKHGQLRLIYLEEGGEEELLLLLREREGGEMARGDRFCYLEVFQTILEVLKRDVML